MPARNVASSKIDAQIAYFGGRKSYFGGRRAPELKARGYFGGRR